MGAESGDMAIAGAVRTRDIAFLSSGSKEAEEARVALVARYGVLMTPGLPTGAELMLVGWVVATSVVAGLVPAVRAYRATLADGLMIRG